MLLNRGHSNLHKYGLTLIKACIQDIYEQRNNAAKDIAIAFRVGRFAKDKDFQNFINPPSIKRIDSNELISM